MKSDPHRLFDDIAADIAQASRDIAGQIEAETKERISVPVEIVTGPRGGRRVIRSKRGEPPRKETGKLQAEVSSEVIETADEIAGSVIVPTHYAAPLENNLNRPILTDKADQHENRIVDSITRAAAGE